MGSNLSIIIGSEADGGNSRGQSAGPVVFGGIFVLTGSGLVGITPRFRQSHLGASGRGVGMRQLMAAACAAALAGLAGCVSGPLLDNPVLLHPGTECVVENPVYVPLGPPSYGTVYETVRDVLDDYFEIARENRYDGVLETHPRIAPGYEQFWKPGSPNSYERLLATLQTIRHRAVVQIQPANDGGFFVKVTVFRELEDLPRPTLTTAGAAAFRGDQTVERQFEVIDPTFFQANWVPIGQDLDFEQRILQRIKKCL